MSYICLGEWETTAVGAQVPYEQTQQNSCIAFSIRKNMIMTTIEKRDNEFTPIYVETRVPGEKPRLFVVIIF